MNPSIALSVEALLAVVPTAIAVRGYVRMRKFALFAETAADDLAVLLNEPDDTRAMSRLEEIGGAIERTVRDLLARQRRDGAPGWVELRTIARALALPAEDGLLLFLLIVAWLLLLGAQGDRNWVISFVCMEVPSVAGLVLLRSEGARSSYRIARSFQRLLSSGPPRSGP